MRLMTIHTLAVVGLASSVVARAQGTFQNLDFEQANIVPIVGSPLYPYAVTVANALPYWSVFYGNVEQSQITFNDPSLGATAVTLYTTGYPVIEGNYSVLLQGGVTLSRGAETPAAASISQTGLIPAGTQSLLFETELGYELLDVYIGSQNVPLTAVRSGPNYTLYGTDISAWAGQTEQLTFSAPSSGVLNDWLLDDISFSAVPEPGMVALSAMSGLLFGARKCFARR